MTRAQRFLFDFCKHIEDERARLKLRLLTYSDNYGHTASASDDELLEAIDSFLSEEEKTSGS